MAHLRSRVNKVPRAVPEGAENVKSGSGPGPTVPFDVDALDAADMELASLAFWCTEVGVSTRDIGPVWRVNGDIRGVLYDSPLAARILTERLLKMIAQPWFIEPPDMHMRMQNVRARHAQKFPVLIDLLNDYEGFYG